MNDRLPTMNKATAKMAEQQKGPSVGSVGVTLHQVTGKMPTQHKGKNASDEGSTIGSPHKQPRSGGRKRAF